ncbi:hypothetical protein CHLNCDRAFT_138516 [Chlorella variabilis]|uniref:Uncharacterized protein n=1 Tax=Chlorella variabilis TaxID=554065 RepID=E1ZUF9_CHLVA|nr:hypothetical protein CHLNCDRAFT_138516 [Chlorella variabilis]EFN50535.1 hypothetical protein CHLNCDRAFT_138516 [Chlorella variabilis]|eukprot:XP_005842667.1 hypothetical protein CHLNCDRAFT_138516 [Chlorella variabilis]
MPPLTAVVTGANKGIGLEIARQLAQHSGTRTVLTARAADRGQAAAAEVKLGYCATDMSSWRGTQSAAQGADTPVWLALLPASENEAITGRFWSGRREEPF